METSDLEFLKEELVEAMKILVYRGLTNPRGGNGSFRYGDSVWITPSGLPKHSLKTLDLVAYDLSRRVFIGEHKPSIEYRVHLKIYEKLSMAKAVLHAHPPLSIALIDTIGTNWLEDTLVETEYSIGRVEVVEPYPPGSKELANNVYEKVSSDIHLVVVPKHGVFAWGKSVSEALDTIIAFEDVAKYYIVKKFLLTGQKIAWWLKGMFI